MDEKMRILNLLKEGKITTEEASSLLDALDKKAEEKDSPGQHFRFKTRFMPGMELIPERIAETISNAVSKLELNKSKLEEARKKMEEAFGQDMDMCEKKFTAKENIAIRTVSGDIEIEGVKSNEIVLDACCGLQKIEDKENELILSMISNDIELKVPFKTNISISSVSGDIECADVTGNLEVQTASGNIELEKISGKIEVKSASGDIEVKNHSGAVDVKTASGDIEVEFDEFADSAIETKSGDVSVVLPKKIDAIIELFSEDGEIELSIDKSYEEIEKKNGYLKIGLGNKSKKLSCQTRSGDIELKQN